MTMAMQDVPNTLHNLHTDRCQQQFPLSPLLHLQAIFTHPCLQEPQPKLRPSALKCTVIHMTTGQQKWSQRKSQADLKRVRMKSSRCSSKMALDELTLSWPMKWEPQRNRKTELKSGNTF
ncbi:hypothetical protein DPMN_043342 [Dreissena polymorpha]|uniref:Uncharacterized protein n=1 Tax=Dreissena polymorpha TaxID=45954 RepID=A0A9D4D237_DREPO|nr:hypothetical protein DPMN_043342 [Dreissena polymorpha]